MPHQRSPDVCRATETPPTHTQTHTREVTRPVWDIHSPQVASWRTRSGDSPGESPRTGPERRITTQWPRSMLSNTMTTTKNARLGGEPPGGSPPQRYRKATQRLWLHGKEVDKARLGHPSSPTPRAESNFNKSKEQPDPPDFANDLNCKTTVRTFMEDAIGKQIIRTTSLAKALRSKTFDAVLGRAGSATLWNSAWWLP